MKNRDAMTPAERQKESVEGDATMCLIWAKWAADHKEFGLEYTLLRVAHRLAPDLKAIVHPGTQNPFAR
jgi:hypothetical protein